MKSLLLVSLILFLSACAQTRWIDKSYEPLGGVISYNNQTGTKQLPTKKAQTEIKMHCGGEYKLLSESEFF